MLHSGRSAWIFVGAIVLAAGYLPTLATPFDFIDDGNLVYPTPGLSASQHVELWWTKVQANYEHLGPFRPTLWVHWQVASNLFGGDALCWRLGRLVNTALAAGMLLWLFRALRIAPVAALLSGAVALWNPYRNEIWTSLTLAEGIAMPYALFALIAARHACRSTRPWAWDLAGMIAFVMALGCKNTFAGLIAPLLILRIWNESLGWKQSLRQSTLRSLVLLLPLALPAAHYFYFKAHWHPGQYETHPPSFAQLGRILNSLKGATSVEFVGIGMAVCTGLVLVRQGWRAFMPYRVAIVAGLVLTLAGIAVYLPMTMMSGRYSMPAVWGLDILGAVVLSAFGSLPRERWRQCGYVLLWLGLLAVTISNMGKQEKFAARAKMLWQALEEVEKAAPTNASIDWVSGDATRGALNIEEGIHFRWHLLHRGRTDLVVNLVDEMGEKLVRVELPEAAQLPSLEVRGMPGNQPVAVPAGWGTLGVYRAEYQLGRKVFVCQVAVRSPRREAAMLTVDRLPEPAPAPRPAAGAANAPPVHTDRGASAGDREPAPRAAPAASR
ncbi:MAG: hypothetical protein ACRCZF_28295 [Gemmataceae bacterium]